MNTTELALINIFIAVAFFPFCLRKNDDTQERELSSGRCAIYLFIIASISKSIWSHL